MLLCLDAPVVKEIGSYSPSVIPFKRGLDGKPWHWSLSSQKPRPVSGVQLDSLLLCTVSSGHWKGMYLCSHLLGRWKSVHLCRTTLMPRQLSLLLLQVDTGDPYVASQPQHCPLVCSQGYPVSNKTTQFLQQLRTCAVQSMLPYEDVLPR